MTKIFNDPDELLKTFISLRKIAPDLQISAFPGCILKPETIGVKDLYLQEDGTFKEKTPEEYNIMYNRYKHLPKFDYIFNTITNTPDMEQLIILKEKLKKVMP